MKLDLAFALENAAWPVFLVDASATIRQANPAAISTFGMVMEGQSALAASVWSPENALTATDFLQRAERSSSPVTHLKFRMKGGATTQFNTYVCPLTRDQQKFFIFQLFSEVHADKAPTALEARPLAPGSPSAPKNTQSGGTTTFRRPGSYISEASAALQARPLVPASPQAAKNTQGGDTTLLRAGGYTSEASATLEAKPLVPASPQTVKNTQSGDTTLLRAGGYTSEASAAQKQKLDCALQLARTLALDFNNALTGILGHSSLILSKLQPTHPWRPSMIEIEKSAQRATELVQDLAGFSRQEKDVRVHAAGNLNVVVRRAVELFQKTGAQNVLWTLQLEKRLFAAHFDEAKMQQAILKLLENAVEAVRHDGRISVRTITQILSEPVLSPALQLAAGHYVCIEISDNGPGIPKEILPRVFEPFFTTKGGPQHRGLGLAWVYGIVTNHGGSVAVISPPGQGTTVRIFLPAQERFVKEQGTRVDDLRGDQTVLIVDDEEMLLTLGQTILAAFGYKVLTANSGQRALEIFEQAPSQIHLVITDMVMPGMSGREFSDHLRRLSQTVPILFTSGYVRGSGEDDNDAAYLRKPYTSQDLLRKVKQILTPMVPAGHTTQSFLPKV